MGLVVPAIEVCFLFKYHVVPNHYQSNSDLTIKTAREPTRF